MNPYIQQLENELNKYHSRCGGEEWSVLDLLWSCYYASEPVDGGHIHRADTALLPVFEELSFQNSNILSDRIDDLCAAYQRAAFLDGLRTGFQLAASLNEK